MSSKYSGTTSSGGSKSGGGKSDEISTANEDKGSKFEASREIGNSGLSIGVEVSRNAPEAKGEEGGSVAATVSKKF